RVAQAVAGEALDGGAVHGRVLVVLEEELEGDFTGTRASGHGARPGPGSYPVMVADPRSRAHRTALGPFSPPRAACWGSFPRGRREVRGHQFATWPRTFDT